MQAIWKGTVSFGLVSIPVRLYAATEEKGVSFRQVHDADGGRIRYKRVCSIDGEEVAYRDIVKGYELPDGDVLVLTDEDLASLPLATKRVIDVLEFVPLEQVDGIYLSKPYFLAAETAGTKPYVLLRDALEAAGRAALVKVALRNRESLAVMRPKDGALLVQTMLWPDEVRDAAAFAPDDDVAVRDQEIAMAQSYIETLSGDFDPDEFTDDYRGALEEVIEAKVQGREVVETAAPDEGGGTVVDLMAALRASVEAARSRRAGGASDAASSPSAGELGQSVDGDEVADDEAAASTGRARKQPARKTRTGKSTDQQESDGSEHSDAAATESTGGDAAATKRSAGKKSADGTAAKRTPAKATAAKSAGKDGSAAKTTTGKSATKRDEAVDDAGEKATKAAPATRRRKATASGAEEAPAAGRKSASARARKSA